MDLVEIPDVVLPPDLAETITGMAAYAGLKPEQMIAALLALYLCKKS